ncbi:hypothetical protein EDD15DRAFT_2278891 [Pisolithus albus]|nr:hypothetical protein EDD15DRAFT_2278891 [Pisolithus albus]
MSSPTETIMHATTQSSPLVDFGITYAPTTVSPRTLAEDGILAHTHPTGSVSRPRLSQSLEDLGVKFVRIQWVDFSNFVHCRVLPISHFCKLLRSSRPGVTIVKVVLGLVFLTMAEGFGATGEYLLVLDLATVRVCGYAPGHAAVFGYFQEKYPLGGRLDVPLCPRTNLKRIVKYVAEELKTEFLVGFETEFILLTTTRPSIQAPNNHGWSKTAAFASGTSELKVLEEIADALATSGIELQMFHSEAAPGQYEVVTGPLTPLEAADALVHTRETIYNIASKHGMRATLAPRLYADSFYGPLLCYQPSSIRAATYNINLKNSNSLVFPPFPAQPQQMASCYSGGHRRLYCMQWLTKMRKYMKGLKAITGTVGWILIGNGNGTVWKGREGKR